MNSKSQSLQARAIAHGLALTLGWLALLGGAHAGQAGSLFIRPVRMELASPRSIGVFHLSNQGDQTIAVQADPVLWTQIEGADDYQPTSNLIVSPPIFNLAPGKEQVVRVAMRSSPEGTQEVAYRIFFTEIPTTEQPKNSGILKVNLRLAVPVFLTPPTRNSLDVDWAAFSEEDGSLSLEISNHRNSHLQLLRLRLFDSKKGNLLATSEGLGYVLANEQHRWKLDLEPEAVPPKPADTLWIEAQAREEKIRAPVYFVAVPVDLPIDPRELSETAKGEASTAARLP